jgi:hypothetical protein
MTPTHEFVEGLARTDARLAELLAEHKRDNDGTLPHVFMGDVARLTGDLARRGGSDEAALDAILAIIESALTSGVADVQELATVSFLENLHQTGDAYAKIAGRLGPRSRRALDVVERVGNGSVIRAASRSRDR